MLHGRTLIWNFNDQSQIYLKQHYQLRWLKRKYLTRSLKSLSNQSNNINTELRLIIQTKFLQDETKLFDELWNRRKEIAKVSYTKIQTQSAK